MNCDLENRLWICCFMDSDFVFLNFIIFLYSLKCLCHTLDSYLILYVCRYKYIHALLLFCILLHLINQYNVSLHINNMIQYLYYITISLIPSIYTKEKDHAHTHKYTHIYEFPICDILKFHHVVPALSTKKSNLIQNMKIYYENIFSSFLIHVFDFTTSTYGNVDLICYMFKSHRIIFSLCYVSTFSQFSPSPRDKFIITWTLKSLYAISSMYYISVLFCFTLSPLVNYNLNFLVSTLYLIPNINLLNGNPLPLPKKYTLDTAPFGLFQRHCVPPLLCYLLNSLLMFRILYIFVYSFDRSIYIYNPSLTLSYYKLLR